MKKKYDDSIDYINGYPISEVWGTYHYLAREIAPRLKAFKAHKKHGWPEDFENQEDWNCSASIIVICRINNVDLE